ncbi:MAG TPA: EAL domain-containing protein [Rhodanobacteraceae bacterium]|nr:EAL domain-containing protein [Rhodanobacteraceae bacterium]
MIQAAPRTARRVPQTARRWAALAAVGVAAWMAVWPPARARATPPTWQAYQRNFYFQQLDSSNGLAQNTVSLVFQDHRGYMWLVTQGGLFRYDGYTLRRFSHEPDNPDSLPGDYRITSLADAADDNLWIGSSSSGLLLFNPQSNKVLPLPKDVQRDRLPVSDLLPLAGGDLLVGSRLGIDKLIAAPTPHLQPVWREPKGQAAAIQSMTECPDGSIYAVAGTDVVSVIHANSGHVLLAGRSAVDALYCTAKGRLLLGDATGLASVDRTSGALTPVWHADGGSPVGVGSIIADHAGRVWAGLSNRSLLRISPDGSLTHVRPAPIGIGGSLPDSRITTLFIDRTGLLWVGTASDGVVWTQPDGSAIRAVLNMSGDPRTRLFVRSLMEAPGGQFWATLNGRGLIRYDPASQTVTGFGDVIAALFRNTHTRAHESKNPALPGARQLEPMAAPVAPADLRFYNLLEGAGGTVLMSSNYGILKFDPATDTASFAEPGGVPARTPIRVLFRARNGDLWAAPYGAGLVHYHDGSAIQRFAPQNGLGSDSVTSIVEDKSGRIWAGTTRGLSMIDPATGKVRTFREIPGRNDSLAGQIVISLLVTRDGTLWAGTLAGLSRLQSIDASGAHFKRYLLSDGLPDNTIDCMLEDKLGDIWFSTNLGIARLDPATGRIRSFGIADGLQGDEYNSGACLRTADGKLLFGGHGFDIIDPANIRRRDKQAPVVITSVYTGKGELHVPANDSTPINIAARDRSLYVTFATLDYAAATRNRFRYRMSGVDAHWSSPSLVHSTGYTDLPLGDHVLEIQSILPDGEPGDTTTLAIHVATAWWWTLPMRIIYVASLALLVLIAVLGWRSHRLEQLRHRRQLRLRESRLRHALWGSGDQFWDWDLERGTILRLGPEVAPGGHHEESMPVDHWRHSMVHPDDLAAVDLALAEHLAGRSEHFEVEHRVRGTEGEWTWVLSRGKIVEHDASGKPLRVCGTERDISALRAADRDRRIASEVIRNMSEAVTVTDLDFRFVSVNTAFTRMTGYAEHEVLGRDASILNGSRHAPDSYSHLRQVLAESGHWRGELWQRRKDGEEFLSWVELNEVCDAAGTRTHMIGVLTDITDRKRAEQELRYLANYDTLTGLPNRALLGERLGAAVISARRSGHKVGLLFLDLDRFKHVNDSLGHIAGDRTLKAAGARLRQCVRENDVVARLGGDEFTVVLEDLIDTRGAEDMAQRLVQAFVKPLNVSSAQETVISPSIGIALYPDHGQTPADLLKCADTAMYYAKERGRNTWAMYHSGMDARARDHATLIGALRRALERNELRLAYQPKMSIRTEAITGMEALLRWHHPELGEIPPSTFIPLAEETGQIHELSAYVFATACADLGRFRDAGHRHITMAINLSAAQLNRPDLTLHICDMLAEHDIAPNQIELELTESMVMANAEQSVRLLGELKSIGARLAIDDFGTGYSSLAYLKRLPIDTLKIDQEFVGDVTTDTDDAAITATIITMAHSLQLKVVAEGVETPEQLAFLKAQRCDEIQGYWLSRPLSADACLEFLNRHAASRVGVT